MNRRRYSRRDYFAKVVLTYEDESGHRTSLPGMIQDRSTWGFGIRVKKTISPGSLIRFCLGSTEYTALVKRSERIRFEFHVGVEIKGENPAPGIQVEQGL